MENLNLSTKRKKRRTRRCLDEIRSRLRRKCAHSSEHSIQNTKTSTLGNKIPENRLVTMDRLTLKAMFPRVITSETITRPVLENMKRKRDIVSEDVKAGSAKKAACPLERDFTNNTTTSFQDMSKCDYISLHNESHFNVCGDVKTCDYVSDTVQSTPERSMSKAVSLSESGGEEDINGSISQDHRVQHYKQLMQKIPFYVRQLASSTDRKNIVKSTIHALQKTYMESQKCGEGIRANVEHILTNDTKKIVENPMDYIRLKHARQQDDRSELESHSDRPSPEKDMAVSPTSQCVSPPDVRISVIPYDTPDYNYYPHQLK